MNDIPKTAKTVHVKRRFVPLRFRVETTTTSLTQSVKLPFTCAKVVGILTTTTAKRKCKDTNDRIVYYGTDMEQMTNTRFLGKATATPFKNTYPENTTFTGMKGWWYYAHPVLDKHPNLIENGNYISNIRVLNPPIPITITHENGCTPVPYLLWSEPLPKMENQEVLVTFYEYS